MNKLLCVCFPYGNNLDPSGIQIKRLNSGLKGYIETLVLYRGYRNSTVPNENEIQAKQIGLSFLDRLCFYISPALACVFSIDQYLWIVKVYNRIKKMHDVDYIMISSCPFPLQILGLFVKRIKKKYIAQFLDPLVDNTYLKRSFILNIFLKKYERFIVKNADLVILNNYVVYSLFSRRYSEYVDKIVVLPHCTENNLNVIQNGRRSGKVKLIHAGSLYGERKITEINIALKEMKQKLEGKLSDCFEILLIGRIDDSIKEEIKQCNNEDIIRIIPPVSATALYEYYSKVDGFIVVDSLNVDNVFFPSKLCEYFSFNKIIFGFSPKISTTRDLLEESGHFCFGIGESGVFAQTLLNLIKDRYCYDEIFDKMYYKKFLPEVVGQKFVTYLKSLS